MMELESPSSMTASNSGFGEASISCFGQLRPTPLPLVVVKKKRNLAGIQDPEVEVVARSPKTLLATNRFVCEVCSKGFPRDQNLELHRKGHHDPSRRSATSSAPRSTSAESTGRRKWKFDRCSKKYAVQSDWKAHAKVCGTREYRCDCGALFSRRKSFIPHRAFSDALAGERMKTKDLSNTNPKPRSGSR